MNQSSKLAAFVVCLFALPFCGFGLFAAFRALNQLSRPAGPSVWIMLVFGLVFLACGAGMMAAALMGIPGLKKQSRLQEEHPDSPWMWRADWAEGRADSKTRSTLKHAWATAFFWNLISGPVVYFVPRETYIHDPKTLLALIFPVVGIGLLVWALRATIAWFEFGKTYFQMTDVPIVAGREFRGAIQVRLPRPPEHGIHLSLSCVNFVVSGSGKNQTRRESILWRDEHTIPSEALFAGPMGTTVPVSFDIPVDARQTDTKDPSNAIVWLLQAQADVPGVDYNDVFEIPVFRTKDTPTLGASQIFRHSPPRISMPVSPTILVRTTGESTEIYFPAARNKGFAAGTTAFLLLWTGVLLLIFHLKAPIIFSVMFGVFEILLGYVVLQLWFGTSTVVINRDYIRFRSGLFGTGKFSEIMSSEIAAVNAVIRSQQGGATGTPYYDMQLVRVDGKKITVGQTIRDKQEAEWLVLQITDALGLKPSAHAAFAGK